MTCPRCGTKTDSLPCPNCGFPVFRKRVKKSDYQRETVCVSGVKITRIKRA